MNYFSYRLTISEIDVNNTHFHSVKVEKATVC